MRGQYIRLAGVTAAVHAGTRQIIMSAADVAAARIDSLAHAVSAKTLTASAGGVTGRCRATGQPLVPLGTVSALTLKTVGGFTGLGLSSISAAAALALPANSASASYTAVMAIALGAADIAGSSPVNPLATYTSAGVAVATVARYYGSAAATNTNKWTTGGGESTISPLIGIDRPATTWAVVVVDFENSTKLVSMSINGGTFSTATRTANHAPGDGGYMAIGLSASSLSLRDSVVGDVYVFNKSMRSTALGQRQLDAIIAALKSDYAIA